MAISFIIPVLNGEKYIRRCIESILSEMDSSDEVIVVDNGSTDETASIVQSFKDVGLLILPKLTVSALRNNGAESTSNQLLAFIDADCILSSGWRRQVITTFSDENLHASGSLYDIPENAGWIEKAWFSQKIPEKARAKYINSGNLIVRRVIFDDLNGFDESLVSDEDCDFGDRLNNAGYIMLENPDIRVVHMGNPKTLKDFYLKEVWHATSTLARFSLKTIDRPTIMSILFGISILMSVTVTTISIFTGAYLLWLALSLLLIIPVITAIFRAFQFGKYNYIPELTLLWSIFYLARIRNMAGYFLARVRN